MKPENNNDDSSNQNNEEGMNSNEGDQQALPRNPYQSSYRRPSNANPNAIPQPFQSRIETQPTTSGFDSSPSVSPSLGGAQKSNRNKKIIIGSAIALVAVLLLGGGAYAWYNMPQKVVSDAVSHMITASFINVKGDATLKADGTEVGLNYGVKSDKKLSQIDMGVKVNAAPMSIDLSGSIFAESNGNTYFKINNAQQIVNNLFGSVAAADPEFNKNLDELTNKVDSKWIKLDATDLTGNQTEEEKKQTQCFEKLFEEISSNDSLGQEIGDAYKDNSFVSTESLPAEGFSSIHYKLTLDEAKTKEFAKALQQTQAFKKAKDCDPNLKVDESYISDTVEEFNAVNTEIWVDRWTHQLSQFKVNGKEDDTEALVQATTDFTTPVALSAPTDATPIDQLMDDVSSLFGGNLLGDTDVSESFELQPSQSNNSQSLREL